MKNTLEYNTSKFEISQNFFDSTLTAKTESMMALGNGYLGLRSVDEENETFNKEDLFVNGIFNKVDDQMVSELANLADSIKTQILLDGQIFRINSNDKYTKTLYIKTGLLKRVIQATRNGKKYELTFKRIVSIENKHIYAQKISIKQLSGKSTKIVVKPQIDGQTTNNGAQHLKEGEKRRPTLTSLQYIEETNEKNLLVIHNMVTKVKIGTTNIKPSSNNYVITMARRRVGFNIQGTIFMNKPFILEKLMSISTIIDKEKYDNKTLNQDANKLHNQLLKMTYTSIFLSSTKIWKDIFNQFDVKIIGTTKDAEYDRLALSFSIFHMNSFVPINNANLSIGAKGLSGEGYQGHSYWDTEFFILPNYLYTKPKVARNLLEYRYKGIEGARKKAKETKMRKEESNLIGAQFPWEMAWPTDGEVCPYWGQANIVTGKQEPIASRRQEIHVSADIAYAIHQYYTFTHDAKFMIDMGYEMIIDTAIFWTYRAEKQNNGTYEIKDVMGPNEYKGNIDNNAYTNELAIKNLELALLYMDNLNKTLKGKRILKKVLDKIPYKFSITQMRDVFKKLKRQLPNKDGIIAENDQFLYLKRMNVKPFQLLGDGGRKLFNTLEGHKILSSQLVKQADVVFLTYLMPEKFSKDIIKKNFEFYEPITTHDSSLSPTTYAIQAIELRKTKLAYKLFKYSLSIDMGPNMKSCDLGIHAGSLAAIWQSITFGYGGLRYINNNIHFNPILPKQWNGLQYSILYQGSQIQVVIEKHKFHLQSINNKKVKVFVDNNEVILNSQIQTFKVQHEY